MIAKLLTRSFSMGAMVAGAFLAKFGEPYGALMLGLVAGLAWNYCQ